MNIFESTCIQRTSESAFSVVLMPADAIPQSEGGCNIALSTGAVSRNFGVPQLSGIVFVVGTQRVCFAGWHRPHRCTFVFCASAGPRQPTLCVLKTFTVNNQTSPPQFKGRVFSVAEVCSVSKICHCLCSAYILDFNFDDVRRTSYECFCSTLL